jgi:Domain of unknown function (DUF4383)
LTKLTIAGLTGCASAIWAQWLSGDPAYRTFPPGPVFFIVFAAFVALAARWWWTPLIGSLLGLLVTAGWFAMLPKEMLRLTHPGSIGGFGPGIFLGTLAQIISLLLTDLAGFMATVQNYRNNEQVAHSSKIVLRIFGAIFVIMGVMVIATGLHADRYHNLMHMIWGVLAVCASLMAVRVARAFCIASGAFYLLLSILGLTMGDPAMGRAWQAGPMLLHTGDHIFHLIIGSILLGFGLLLERGSRYQETPA